MCAKMNVPLESVNSLRLTHYDFRLFNFLNFTIFISNIKYISKYCVSLIKVWEFYFDSIITVGTHDIDHRQVLSIYDRYFIGHKHYRNHCLLSIRIKPWLYCLALQYCESWVHFFLCAIHFLYNSHESSNKLQ